MNFENRCDDLIRFYKELKAFGWSVDDLKKQMVRDLQGVKRYGVKSIKDAAEDAINDIDNYFRENFMEEDQISVGVVQEILEENYFGLEKFEKEKKDDRK